MKTLLKVGAAVVVLIALFVVNVAYYPFFTTHPNYSDVERVFNKMQFPSDWQEIDSSENKGIAGRACPIESESACYHKSRTFKLPTNVTIEDVKKVLMHTGCPVVAVSDNTAQGSNNIRSNLDCSVEGLSVGAGFRDTERELYVGIISR